MVDATIQGIHRGTIYSDVNFHLEAATVSTATEPEPTAERIETPIYNLVIEHPEGTILWDTGSHPDAGDGHWPAATYATFEQPDAVDHPLEADLADAGYDLADIDAVVCSHLHVDHAGGLHAFDGTNTPIYVHEKELQFAYYSACTPGGDGGGYVREDFDHDLDWRIVHQDRTQFFEGIEFIRLPGHAPGLMGMLVHLDGYGSLLFGSDVAELEANYHDERPLGASLLRDRQAWTESIRTLQDLERRHDATVIYGHDPDQHERVLEGWG
ncbi:N-acyl homoserine lactonase family protein [Salinarchaeum laminariae]|uniref:N-acyl homoserine lactonase family protein n=1 Tax=Salinarchaeum laminariae TaxID=869888 RepID=UPI0020BE302D|nr:N-acyl homoserine lactonase family protein [Salinarchaeum laminariae]